MRAMMDYLLWNQRREELLCEAEMNRQVKALLVIGRWRADRRSALVWQKKTSSGSIRTSRPRLRPKRQSARREAIAYKKERVVEQ